MLTIWFGSACATEDICAKNGPHQHPGEVWEEPESDCKPLSCMRRLGRCWPAIFAGRAAQQAHQARRAELVAERFIGDQFVSPGSFSWRHQVRSGAPTSLAGLDVQEGRRAFTASIRACCVTQHPRGRTNSGRLEQLNGNKEPDFGGERQQLEAGDQLEEPCELRGARDPCWWWPSWLALIALCSINKSTWHGMNIQHGQVGNGDAPTTCSSGTGVRSLKCGGGGEAAAWMASTHISDGFR